LKALFPLQSLSNIPQAGETLLSVPTSALRTLLTVPKPLSSATGPITVHGLLALTLTLDTSAHYTLWRAVLPSPTSIREFLPLFWPPPLQALLPPAAATLLANQIHKLSLDWTAVTTAFPSLAYDEYIYNWCLVNTRTFYFTSPLVRLPKPINRDDCMALNPFADYFNHAAEPSASASFSSSSQKSILAKTTTSKSSTSQTKKGDGTGYIITALHAIAAGDEIYISYGSHSNDFLLAEYGFILSSNPNQPNKDDSILLDTHLLQLFTSTQTALLSEAGFKGNYTLDIEGLCYRTKIAVRLLCMPVGKWKRMVSIGLEDADAFEKAAGEVLLKVLGAFREEVDEKVEAVGRLDCGLESQRDVLRRRWEQIRILVCTAVERVKGNA
jgi:hypothetical protein